MTDATSFTIEELTGTNNIIELVARALPYRPFSLMGKMRAEKTWYAGNPIATLQMLGPDEGSTTVNGFWKNRFLMTQTELGIPVIPEGAVNFNGVPLRAVYIMADQVDQMRLRGQLVKVTWGAQIRVGYLADFKQDWINGDDMQWEMTFEWVSKGDLVVPVLFALPIPPVDISGILISLVQALEAIVLAPFQVIASVQGVITTALSDIDDTLAVIRQTANKVSQQIISPLTAAQNTISAAQQIQADAQSIADVVISKPARALISVSNIQEITQEDCFVAADWARSTRASARQLQFTSAELCYNLAGLTTNQTTLASFYARDDMDLRDVSVAYYDTPDEWHRIAAFNNIKGSRLSAGQQILVPQLGIAGENT